ncbi:hypothetical protein GJ496_009271 [Pomphorhynchus laevis]|nr:hypothetical protein GJ496_009271 [Pomphorhynchus laevis]
MMVVCGFLSVTSNVKIALLFPNYDVQSYNVYAIIRSILAQALTICNQHLQSKPNGMDKCCRCNLSAAVEQYRHTLIHLRRAGYTIIILLGLIGNTLLYMSMSKFPYRKKVIGFVMKSIVMCDMLNILLMVGRCLEFFNVAYWPKLTNWWPDQYVYICTQCSSNWFLVILSIERVLSFHYMRTIKFRRKTWKIILLGTAVLFMIAYIPVPLYVYFNETAYRITNNPSYIPDTAYHVRLILSVFYHAVCVSTPFFTFIVCYFMLFRSIRKNKNVAFANRDFKRRERYLTLQILYITVFNVIVEAPLSIFEIIGEIRIYNFGSKLFTCSQSQQTKILHDSRKITNTRQFFKM